MNIDRFLAVSSLLHFTTILKENSKTAIDGFIEVNGAVHRIRSKEDIEKVLKLL